MPLDNYFHLHFIRILIIFVKYYFITYVNFVIKITEKKSYAYITSIKINESASTSFKQKKSILIRTLYKIRENIELILTKKIYSNSYTIFIKIRENI